MSNFIKIDGGHIRIATKTDIPALNKLINCSYRGEFSKIGWTTEADLLGGVRVDEEYLEQEISKTDTLIMVYLLFDEEKKQDEIVGCVQLKTEGEVLYVGMVTVFPPLQNKGLGKIIMNSVEEYCHNNNFKKQRMTVISKRTELINWYERRGFNLTGGITKFEGKDCIGVPKVDLEFVLMEKEMK